MFGRKVTLIIRYKSGHIVRVKCKDWKTTIKTPTDELTALNLTGFDNKPIYFGIVNIESIWEK